MLKKAHSGRGAVGYVRVSSAGQVEGVSLDDQAAAIAKWCEASGLELLATFREAGRSGRTTEHRAELRRALEFCASRAGEVSAFVVYDLSRFARDAADQLRVQELLRGLGVRLTSVTLDLSDDPYGGLVSGLFGNINEFFSRQSGEKIRRCMAEVARRGGWPWAAPLGYLNTRQAGRKAVELDPAKAPLVRRGFELVASGVGPLAALRSITAAGLRGRHGREVRIQEWRKMLASPFYAGRVVSSELGVDVDGLHPPLVDRALWLEVQARLTERAPAPSPSAGSEFPLRGVVRCEACGKQVTASASRGKSGRRFGYYHCWSGCKAVRIPAAVLEADFVDRLSGLEIDPDAWTLVEAMLLEALEGERSTRRERLRVVERRRAELGARRDRLVESYLDQAIDRPTYSRHLQVIDRDIQILDFEHLGISNEAEEPCEVLGWVKTVTTGLSRIWSRLDQVGRVRLAGLVYPEGVTVSREGLRTPVTSWIFRGLDGISCDSAEMVEQARGGSNPGRLLEWLHQAAEIARRAA